MKKFLKFLDEDLEEFLMVICLVIISCVILLNVIMRYIVKQPLSWPEELARYCYVYSGMFSAGYCLRRGISFRVDLLYQVFPKSVQIIIEYIGKLLVLFLYAFMAYASINLVATTTSISTAMQIPIKFIYLSIPIGMTLGVIRGIQDLIRYTLKTFKREGEAC